MPLRIDAHQHFWHYEPARHTWITDEMSVLRRDFLPEDLRPELSAAGIDATILVQVDQSEQETHSMLELAEANAEIAGVVGWVDLQAANIRERLEHFSRFPKLRGFRHIAQSEPDNDFLIRENFLRGISQLTEFDFTYDILIYPKQLPAALELVRHSPNQRFVVDHLAKPLIKTHTIEPWATHMRSLAKCPNAFCKLSGMITEADWGNWEPCDFTPYLDAVFEAFGTDRLMFGSDWPVCLLAGSYARVKRLIADYASSDHDKIFGLNAASFHRLDSTSARIVKAQ
jgi:L-fuconolactonase